MPSYTIRLYQSNTLEAHCDQNYGDGDQALDRAQTYLDNAIGNVPGSSANVVKYSTSVPSPREWYKNENSWYTEACGDWDSYIYLSTWFRDWVNCSLNGSSHDVDMLLTQNDAVDGGSMKSLSGFGVAQTGKYAAQVPSSYDGIGFTDAHNGMETILHEFAHYALDGSTGDDHARGDENHVSGDGWAKTPVLDFNSDYLTTFDKNWCDENIPTENPDGFIMNYDECNWGEW